MSLDVYIYDKDPDLIGYDDSNELYWANITHNLNKMAMEAGIYDVLWDAEEKGYKYSKDILPILTDGFCKMLKDPKHYKKFDSSNGWGTYDDFIDWIFSYIKALTDYPNGLIRISK